MAVRPRSRAVRSASRPRTKEPHDSAPGADSARPVRSGLGHAGRDRRTLRRIRVELVREVASGFGLAWAELAITHEPIDPDLEFAIGNGTASGLGLDSPPIFERR